MKKFLALFLVLVLLTGLFAGCAKKEETEEPAPSTSETPEKTETPAEEEEAAPAEELSVIELYDPAFERESSLGTPIGDYIAENFGLEYKWYTYTGDEIEKQGMMLAGGDYGGLVELQSAAMIQNYIEAGALVNLDDYKDQLPDFYAYYESVLPYWRQEAPDGGVYFWHLDALGVESIEPYEIMVRTDVLEYYGWPEIITEQDWLEFLAQAMKDFPTSFNGEPTVGMTVNMADDWFYLGCVADLYDKGDSIFAMANEPWLYDLKQEKVVSISEVEDVKTSLQWWNDMYQAGVLDPECVSDFGDNVLAKMSDGRAIASYYGSWYIGSANQALIDAGHPEMQFIQLPVQATRQVEAGEGRAYMTSLAGSTFHTRAITKNMSEETLEKFLKFLNWSCTDEGRMLLTNGIEGRHWTVDESGNKVPTELRTQMYLGEVDSVDEGLVEDYWVPRGGRDANGEPYSVITQEFRDQYELTDRQKEAYAAMGYTSSKQWWEEHAVWYDGTIGWLTPSAQPLSDTEMGRDYAKWRDALGKYHVQLIFSDDFEATWNEYVTEIDKLDWQGIIDYMNSEVDRMAAELGLK